MTSRLQILLASLPMVAAARDELPALTYTPPASADADARLELAAPEGEPGGG